MEGPTDGIFGRDRCACPLFGARFGVRPESPTAGALTSRNIMPLLGRCPWLKRHPSGLSLFQCYGAHTFLVDIRW